MNPLRSRTPLRLEALEDRTLLDGKVTAAIVNGRLFITGDDKANVFTLERVAGSNGTVGFHITPDASTAINDQPVGVAVDLGDAIDVRVDSRGGADQVQVLGTPGSPFCRALSVEGGTGADTIKLQDVLVSSLSLSSLQGNDGFDLQRVVSGGGGSGGSVLVRCTDGSCAVSITDSTVLGPLSVVCRGATAFSSSHSSFADVTITDDGRGATPLSSSTSFDACTAGTVRVSSRGGGHQFSMDDSRCSSLYLKYEGTQGVASSSSTTLDNSAVAIEISSWSWGMSNSFSMSSSSAGRVIDKASPILARGSSSLYLFGGQVGSVSVSSNGAYDLKAEGTKLSSLACAVVCPPGQSSSTTLTDVDMDGAVRVTAQGSHTFSMSGGSASDIIVKMDRLSAVSGSSRVAVSDASVAGQLSVTSRGSADVSLDACRSAVDFFLKIDGIKGETARSSLSVTGCPVGDTVVRSTSALDITTGASSFASLSVDLSCPDPTTRMVIKMEDCLVSGYTLIAGRTGGYDLAVGKGCSFDDFTIKLDRATPSATSSTVLLDSSSVSSRLSIQSRGSLDATLSSSRAADIYLKIDGIKGESARSNLQLGSLAVEDCVLLSRAPVDVTTSGSSFDSLSLDLSCPDPTTRMSIKMEDCIVSSYSVTGRVAGYDLKMNKRCVIGDASVQLSKGSAVADDSTVSVDSSTITGRLSVTSSGATDVSLSFATCGDTFIKIDSIKGERAMSSLTFSNIVHRDLAVRATCPVDLSATDSSFASITCDQKLTVSGTTLSPRLRLGSVAVAGAVSVSSSGAAADFSFGSSNAGSLMCRVDTPTGLSSSISVADLDCDGRMDFVSRGQTAVVALACTAGDMAIKLDRVASSQPPSSVTLEGVHLSGELSVSSRASADVSAVQCQTSHLQIKMDAMTGDTGRSHVSVADLDCDGVVEVVTATPTDFTGSSLRAVDFFLKIDVLRASPPASTVSLTDSAFSGALSLASGSGADQFSLTRVAVLDRVLFSGGTGDDVCALVACTLQGQAVFDGGAGASDTFSATADCVFASPPAVVGFEKVSGLPTP